MAAFGRLFYLAKHPRENRVYMLGVIPQIKLLADFLFRQRLPDFLVCKQFFKEISAMLPDLP